MAIAARRPNPVSLRSCIWDVGKTTWVTAVSVPADQWVADLPDEGDTSINLDLSAAVRRHAAAAKGCAAFERVLAAKRARGPILITVAAGFVDLRSVTASTCTRDVFTSVTVIRGIRAPHVPDALLSRDLTLAHRRALAGR